MLLRPALLCHKDNAIRVLASAISEYLSDSPPTYLDTVALEAGVADHNHRAVGAEVAVRNHHTSRAVKQA